MKLFEIGPLTWEEMTFKRFFFSIFSCGGDFVQPSRTILAILIESHSRTIPIKLFQNPLIRLGGDVLSKLSKLLIDT